MGQSKVQVRTPVPGPTKKPKGLPLAVRMARRWIGGKAYRLELKGGDVGLLNDDLRTVLGSVRTLFDLLEANPIYRKRMVPSMTPAALRKLMAELAEKVQRDVAQTRTLLMFLELTGQIAEYDAWSAMMAKRSEAAIAAEQKGGAA